MINSSENALKTGNTHTTLALDPRSPRPTGQLDRENGGHKSPLQDIRSDVESAHEGARCVRSLCGRMALWREREMLQRASCRDFDFATRNGTAVWTFFRGSLYGAQQFSSKRSQNGTFRRLRNQNLGLG